MEKLFQAIIDKDLSAISIEIDKLDKKSINKIHDGETPLTLAAKGGSYAVIDMLLNKGADQNIRNASHQFPMNVALENGHMNAWQLLRTHKKNAAEKIQEPVRSKPKTKPEVQAPVSEKYHYTSSRAEAEAYLREIIIDLFNNTQGNGFKQLEALVEEHHNHEFMRNFFRDDMEVKSLIDGRTNDTNLNFYAIALWKVFNPEGSMLNVLPQISRRTDRFFLQLTAWVASGHTDGKNIMQDTYDRYLKSNLEDLHALYRTNINFFHDFFEMLNDDDLASLTRIAIRDCNNFLDNEFNSQYEFIISEAIRRGITEKVKVSQDDLMESGVLANPEYHMDPDNELSLSKFKFFHETDWHSIFMIKGDTHKLKVMDAMSVPLIVDVNKVVTNIIGMEYGEDDLSDALLAMSSDNQTEVIHWALSNGFDPDSINYDQVLDHYMKSLGEETFSDSRVYEGYLKNVVALARLHQHSEEEMDKTKLVDVISTLYDRWESSRNVLYIGQHMLHVLDLKDAVNTANSEGSTMLMRAAFHHDDVLIHHLIYDGKADIEITNKDGLNAFAHIALDNGNCSESRQMHAAEVFIDSVEKREEAVKANSPIGMMS